jgi:DNA-directed RNA polymerase specialized sigma24 family protein
VRLELDELVNELFIRLRADGWRALRDFRGANLSGRSCGLIRYIQCIAARLLWKKMDRAVKETAWLQPLDELEDVRLPDDAAERRRLAADVIEAIMALDNPLDRQAILLYKIEGREVAEAARLLKTTPATSIPVQPGAPETPRPARRRRRPCLNVRPSWIWPAWLMAG